MSSKIFVLILLSVTSYSNALFKRSTPYGSFKQICPKGRSVTAVTARNWKSTNGQDLLFLIICRKNNFKKSGPCTDSSPFSLLDGDGTLGEGFESCKAEEYLAGIKSNYQMATRTRNTNGIALNYCGFKVTDCGKDEPEESSSEDNEQNSTEEIEESSEQSENTADSEENPDQQQNKAKKSKCACVCANVCGEENEAKNKQTPKSIRGKHKNNFKTSPDVVMSIKEEKLNEKCKCDCGCDGGNEKKNQRKKAKKCKKRDLETKAVENGELTFKPDSGGKKAEDGTVVSLECNDGYYSTHKNMGNGYYYTNRNGFIYRCSDGEWIQENHNFKCSAIPETEVIYEVLSGSSDYHYLLQPQYDQSRGQKRGAKAKIITNPDPSICPEKLPVLIQKSPWYGHIYTTNATSAQLNKAQGWKFDYSPKKYYCVSEQGACGASQPIYTYNKPYEGRFYGWPGEPAPDGYKIGGVVCYMWNK